MSDIIVDALSVIEGNCAVLFDAVGESAAWRQRVAFNVLKAEVERLRDARSAALEEAAKVADQVDRENKNHDLRWGAQRIAERIRALKEVAKP